MVKNILALTRNGLADWLVQRVSAVIIALYLIFLLGYLLFSGPISYGDWHHLFSHTAMRLFTFLFVLSLVGHAWVGLWTILTDYIKCPVLRATLQVLIILGLLSCLFWGMAIIWGLSV